MRSWRHNTPLFQASIVFVFLFGIVVFLSVKYDFSQMPNMGGMLFLMASMCCMLIAKITYDESKSALTQYDLDTELASELAFGLSAATYTELFKNSPVPYLVVDGQGFIQSINTAAVRLLGEQSERLIGSNVFERLHTSEESHIQFIVEKFQNNIAMSDELVMVERPDRQPAWALLSLFRFVSKHGENAGLLTLVDITRQKKAEDAKSEFVSLASHQLRTPIAGMKWSVELLQMDDTTGSLNPRQRKYVDRLLLSINRMALLVDDFLRVSRFDLGTFEPEYESVTVADVIADVVQESSARAAQKSLRVTVQPDQHTTIIRTDPNLLRMIATNLYTNAVKYTPQSGEVVVSYRTSGDTFYLVVSDSGMGIPKADQPFIFSKLYRASNATRDIPEGTGLGLYIAREAAQVLGGTITFTSAEKQGTTFEVALPI